MSCRLDTRFGFRSRRPARHACTVQGRSSALRVRRAAREELGGVPPRSRRLHGPHFCLPADNYIEVLPPRYRSVSFEDLGCTLPNHVPVAAALSSHSVEARDAKRAAAGLGEAAAAPADAPVAVAAGGGGAHPAERRCGVAGALVTVTRPPPRPFLIAMHSVQPRRACRIQARAQQGQAPRGTG